MGNTGKEGLHLACLGETYQAVVFGFAGLHLSLIHILELVLEHQPAAALGLWHDHAYELA